MNTMGLKPVDYALAGVLILGGVAWGLHAFYIDPVDMLLKQYARFAYGAIGIAAGMSAYRLFTKKTG